MSPEVPAPPSSSSCSLSARQEKNQRIFHTTALGSMGFGIAASIGACLGGGGRPVVCVDGDGGFQCNIQELETVKRLNLPIKFFVLNNEGYKDPFAPPAEGIFFGETIIGCDEATGQTLPDVRKVAEAYGIRTDIITSQDSLAAEIQRVINTPGPVVCDVHIVLDEIRQPRLASTQLPGRFLRLQASRRPVAVPQPRRVPREHDHSLRYGLGARCPQEGCADRSRRLHAFNGPLPKHRSSL